MNLFFGPHFQHWFLGWTGSITPVSIEGTSSLFAQPDAHNLFSPRQRHSIRERTIKVSFCPTASPGTLIAALHVLERLQLISRKA
jgi:hypothetical protein